MESPFIQRLLEQAKTDPQRIVFPESGAEKILLAAQELVRLGAGRPILIGVPEQIAQTATAAGVSLEGVDVIDHTAPGYLENLWPDYSAQSSLLSEKAFFRKCREPLNFAAALVKAGRADCLAAGINYTTGDVIFASQMMIGMAPGISTVSSLGILEIPGWEGSNGNLLGITDCAVCPAPTASDLADIAVSACDTLRRLTGTVPRAAMLSFSTKGSAQHDNIDKIVQAVELAQERRPDLYIDGEFQLDAAIVPAAAAKKVKEPSQVAGQANIIVFPDLNAGNIGVKLVQNFAHCPAHGPLLQGFSCPVTDFSRSAPLEEMLGALAMVMVTAQKEG